MLTRKLFAITNLVVNKVFLQILWIWKQHLYNRTNRFIS